MLNIFEKFIHRCINTKISLLSAGEILKPTNIRRCLPTPTSSHFSWDPRRHLSSTKDVAPRPDRIGTIGSGDILMQSIRSASRVDHVLATIKTHYSIMNNRQAMGALRSIFMLQKNKCSSLRNEDILQSKEFENLCIQLKKQSRSMNTNSLIESLKILAYFGAPVNSVIVQTVFHLIRHQINDLSLHQIIFLHFLCEKFDSNPIVEALTIALPMVFENNVKHKMDKENINHLAQLLKYATQNRVSDSCITELIEAISCNNQPLEGRAAMQVVVAMLRIPSNDPLFVNTAQQAMKKIASSLKYYNYDEISYLLEKLAEKCSKHREFYNEDFVDKCATYVIENDLGFHNAVWTLRRLSKVAHTNLPILDYIAEKIEATPELLENCKTTYIFSLPTGFANMNYKPKNWDQIKDLLLKSYKNIYQENFNLPWIKFALDFAALDCFDNQLLELVFSERFLRHFLARDNNLLDHLQLLCLYQSVKTLHPEYKGSLPAEDIIEKAKEINGENVKDFPLKSALEKGCGGELYVQTKSYTSLGHFIDHVVAVRRGGFPVALNQVLDSRSTSRVFLEEFKLPQDGQIVLVLAIPPGSYSLNGKRLRGSVALRIKTLEALGYAVVSISTDDWKSLQDYEKIPFLMQAIRLKALDQFEDRSYL